MTLDDSVDDGESEARPLSFFFRCEERFEYPALHFLIESDSGKGKVHTDQVISLTRSAYSVAFNDTAKRWEFKGLKAGGSSVKAWTFEIDANGDLMPYVEA